MSCLEFWCCPYYWGMALWRVHRLASQIPHNYKSRVRICNSAALIPLGWLRKNMKPTPANLEVFVEFFCAYNGFVYFHDSLKLNVPPATVKQ